MKVSCIQCPKCGDIVFSRARHDFRSCSCHEIAVDGNGDYTKICFAIVKPKTFELKIKQTKQELFDDWNFGRDKFGIINKNAT